MGGNPLWNPINLHRFLANIACGGAIVRGYAAYMFLAETNKKARAHYDWMGYTSNFIVIAGFLPLPFASYWLMAEIYAYSQQMGITAMGGILAWLFIIQAVLIGTIMLAANYYLWCGLMRTDRGATYAKYVKNTAANLMLVFTFLSFQMFYRSSRIPTVSWARAGNMAIIALYAVGCANNIGAGIYGYITPTVYKVGASVPQVQGDPPAEENIDESALDIAGMIGFGERLDHGGLTEAILAPNAIITEGFDADLMPDDFSQQMRVSELNLILDYLQTLPE